MSRWRHVLLVVAALWITTFAVNTAKQSIQAESLNVIQTEPKVYTYRTGEAAMAEIRAFEYLIRQRIKQPKFIPFEVKTTLTSTSDLGSDLKKLHIVYIGENEHVEVRVIPADVKVLIPGYSYAVARDGRRTAGPNVEYRTVTLANGTEALYTDNGIVQGLLWKDGDLSYDLVVGNRDNKSVRPVEDIIKIADSFDH
ncbi:MAG: hypothetical protein DIU71_19085 [Proteobacteria bacterium]|nr:MAG: hypothetical protein DIU71_19085 [Pseudomonadota bacterium]